MHGEVDFDRASFRQPPSCLTLAASQLPPPPPPSSPTPPHTPRPPPPRPPPVSVSLLQQCS